MRQAAAPSDLPTLLDRARALAGHDLTWLARQVDAAVPPDLRHHKGWVGQLLEAALGATAGSRAEPDFPHLGVELKTLPVSAEGRVKQTTWVCHAPMDRAQGTWEHSDVRRKLARVLFIPIVGDHAVEELLVGTPLYWEPSVEQQAVLRRDWEEHVEKLATGALADVHARAGVALQLRPKAAHASDWVWVLDEEGDWVQATPRGFYLRRSFTQSIVDEAFGR